MPVLTFPVLASLCGNLKAQSWVSRSHQQDRCRSPTPAPQAGLPSYLFFGHEAHSEQWEHNQYWLYCSILHGQTVYWFTWILCYGLSKLTIFFSDLWWIPNQNRSSTLLTLSFQSEIITNDIFRKVDSGFPLPASSQDHLIMNHWSLRI